MTRNIGECPRGGGRAEEWRKKTGQEMREKQFKSEEIGSEPKERRSGDRGYIKLGLGRQGGIAIGR